ncbi:MAG: type III-A CRISPR-associated RAMP protein Csm3 [Candidatus Kuenenia stuttgartiensis]|uniref:CRISPR system Cms endoribonuclease Csm3 n=1 Tax=Kuenenia stuttgartiensis TaxID=174633 RepID=A0A2C9C9U1_KUEST|nr:MULTISPECIES: type III-A CRISPR-associated RAMP protein Csm3 [Kuenenia]MBZ0191946.1 type III-A CRISPR-associated RAMP protein Csm3 [Candidatus Kuenenia stuttgartiensis]MCL4727892.1 type III-A CRISPR-associated RAMP protein Csm3 [Candidatus Kuenenia stuttgartiensis]MCZ7623138.1 type III-A CRISPR-associated RAMP protein Csm3 [Candidatus Kuenenia sp.]SOH02629.1 hypothetical protein KSMBR1_0108 [Candidatus Kuenenia stuttgartiensis]GJQ48198.1 MAG: type III-A CRISPR-associated RAMP protein Csm3 [
MPRLQEKPLLGKIFILGKIKCETGLHIGGSKEKMDIGGIDAPVMRDPLTREPYIPGSSLKGKLRSLFERMENKQFNRSGGGDVWRHECTDSQCYVCRLFGSTGSNADENLPSRLSVRDCLLEEESREKLKKIDTGLQYTEWKFENSLDRVTAAANPRQLERIPAGAKFEFEIVYNVEASNGEAKKDLSNLLELISLLQDDYLGGHGSRGYGKVGFTIDKFMARKLEFYRATSEEDKKSNSSILENKTIDECKQNVDEILSMFDIL